MSVKKWNATKQEAENIVGSQIEAKEIYSTSEVKTNKVWVDGKPIYRCVVKRSTVGDIDLTSLNIDEMIDVSGYLLSSSTSRMPLCYYENANYYCHWSWANVRKTIVFVQAGNTAYSPTVIVEYTKTTD